MTFFANFLNSSLYPLQSNFGRLIAAVLGFLVGSVVNMAIVWVGPKVIPLPDGVEMSGTDKLVENIKLLKLVNFLASWLAHALGTLVGAFVAAKLSVQNRTRPAVIVGTLFLLGGISMAWMVGGSTWLILTDLVGAYLPMAFWSTWLAEQKSPRKLGFETEAF